MRIERREFLGIAAVAAAGFAINGKASAQDRLLELTERSVSELAGMMASGKTTSVAITAGYLARVRSIDKKLNSIIELNPDALAIARERDAERRNNKLKGPLHGIHFLIKDNIDTADKMKTTAGSLALIDAPAPKHDAFIVEQLREAGAVLLGKTNLSEWANFRDGSASSGWSGRGGQTHNPYILRPQPVRLFVRDWSGDRGEPCGHRHRHGNRRLDRLPFFDLRDRRHQTNRWFGIQKRHHSDLGFSGHSGPNVPFSGRRRFGAVCNYGCRSAGPGDSSERGKVSTRLPNVARCERAERCQDRRRTRLLGKACRGRYCDECRTRSDESGWCRVDRREVSEPDKVRRCGIRCAAIRI